MRNECIAMGTRCRRRRRGTAAVLANPYSPRKTEGFCRGKRGPYLWSPLFPLPSFYFPPARGIEWERKEEDIKKRMVGLWLWLGLALSIAPRPIDPNCYFFFFLPPPPPKPLPLPFPWLPAYEWGKPQIELTQPIVASDRMEAAFFIARRPTIFLKSVSESDVRV